MTCDYAAVADVGLSVIGSPNSFPTTLSRKILLYGQEPGAKTPARPAVYLCYFRETRLLARAGFVVLLYKIFCVALTYIFATVSYHRVATTLRSDEMDTFNRAPTVLWGSDAQLSYIGVKNEEWYH